MAHTSGTARWQEWAANPRVWLAVVIVVVAIAFILQNRDSTQVTVMSLHLVSPLWITLTVVFLAGLATGLLVQRRRR